MSKSIVKACVRYNDRLYTGFDHGECFKKLNEDNMIIVHSYIEEGFVDSDGNFVDRKQAMIIARESGQLAHETNKKTLISEDLHLNWLNQQEQRITKLEEQLKKMTPKFKVGQKIYMVDCKKMNVFCGTIEKTIFTLHRNNKHFHMYDIIKDIEPNWICGISEEWIFSTKEDAIKKLEELRGENK